MNQSSLISEKTNSETLRKRQEGVKVGRTSMVIEVGLVGEDPYTGETAQACTAKFVMVAVGPDSKPVSIKD